MPGLTTHSQAQKLRAQLKILEDLEDISISAEILPTTVIAMTNLYTPAMINIAEDMIDISLRISTCIADLRKAIERLPSTGVESNTGNA
jgi:hypothetical protein